MTRPVLVPFRAEHAMSLINRDTLTSMEISEAVAREQNGPAYTALLGDKIIACSGVMVMWPGVGYAWASFSDEMYDHRVWVTRMVRRALVDIAKALNLHRIEAVALCDSGPNQDWLELLGFTPEGGVARKYTQDKRSVRRYEFIP